VPAVFLKRRPQVRKAPAVSLKPRDDDKGFRATIGTWKFAATVIPKQK
jgi:hypothetical protein